MPSEIVITGVKELEAKIGRMRTLNVLAPPMVRSLARLQKTASTYPSRPASGKRKRYVRTRLFGRSWTMSIDNDGKTLNGLLDNPTPYGPYVMGPGPDAPKQAWMHVDIWQTTEDVAEKHANSIVADFTRTIQAELNK